MSDNPEPDSRHPGAPPRVHQGGVGKPPLPSAIRARLQAEAAGEESGGHLDSNLLAAFAENTLRPAERTATLDHLARCGTCREALSLSMPPAGAGPRLLATSPARHHYGSLSTRTLLFARLAATITVAVGIGITYYRAHDRPQDISPPPALITPATPGSSAPATSESSNEGASAPATTVTAGRKVREEQKIAQNADASGASLKAVSGRDRGRSENQRAGESKPANAPRADAVAEAPNLSAARQSGAAPALGKKVPSAPLQSDSPLIASKDKIAAQAPAPYPAEAEAKPKTLSSPVSAANSSDDTAGTAYSEERAAPVKTQAMAPGISGSQWRVSRSAGLQRMTQRSSETSSRATSASWTDVQVAREMRFFAVTSVGNHVWAVGTAARLFYSSDDGLHWKQITGPWRRDVVAMRFTDLLHGELRTSAGERWLTADGGEHWQPEEGSTP